MGTTTGNVQTGAVLRGQIYVCPFSEGRAFLPQKEFPPIQSVWQGQPDRASDTGILSADGETGCRYSRFGWQHPFADSGEGFCRVTGIADILKLYIAVAAQRAGTASPCQMIHHINIPVNNDRIQCFKLRQITIHDPKPRQMRYFADVALFIPNNGNNLYTLCREFSAQGSS